MAPIGVTAAPAAIVLVGGRSSRMGTDKASLVVDGATMADRVLSLLAAAAIGDVVLAGSQHVPDPGVEAGEERQGPLAGIVAGWRELQSRATGTPDPVIVLSCDLPSLSLDVITGLLAASDKHVHGVLAHDGDRPQPLIAAYHPAALDELVAAYVAGERSVRRCFTTWDLGHVHFNPVVLTDADTPADLDGFDVQWPSS